MSGFPRVTWDPVALTLFCERHGLSRSEAAAMIEAENTQIAAAWASYRRRHPGATLRAFALDGVEATALKMLAERGVPPARARVLARNIRHRAAEHAP